jgi:hypothetical protein
LEKIRKEFTFELLDDFIGDLVKNFQLHDATADINISTYIEGHIVVLNSICQIDQVVAKVVKDYIQQRLPEVYSYFSPRKGLRI